MLRTLLLVSLMMLSLPACSYRAPGQVTPETEGASQVVQLPTKMPRMDASASLEDYSGAYQTFTKAPKRLDAGVQQSCDFLFAGKTSEDWTLSQVGNRIEGFNREVSPVLGKWSWVEERFSGYILQGKLRLNGQMTGSFNRVDNDGIVHYELSYDRENGYLVGTRNGAPYWAVPCAGLIGKAHLIEPLGTDGQGRRNHMLEVIKDKHPEPSPSPAPAGR